MRERLAEFLDIVWREDIEGNLQRRCGSRWRGYLLLCRRRSGGTRNTWRSELKTKMKLQVHIFTHRLKFGANRMSLGCVTLNWSLADVVAMRRLVHIYGLVLYVLCACTLLYLDINMIKE